MVACAEISGSVRVGRSAWIGPSASVLNGVEIGTGAQVSIGTVVTPSIPEWSVVLGNPARIIGSRDRAVMANFPNQAEACLFLRKVRMTKKVFLRSMEQVLEVEPGTLTGNERLGSFNWDSVAILSFIAMADEQFHVNVPPERIMECRTVAELMALTPVKPVDDQ